MNRPNMTPLVMSAVLLILVAVAVIRRVYHSSIWQDAAINADLLIPGMYVVWILFESNISIKELTRSDKTSDYGTCELYAIGQAGVLLSALWFTSVWESPNPLHLLGLLFFIAGILFRIWAIITLGPYYSHIVREIDAHKIIDSGPYHYIRHPAYTGMILANTGIALFFFNAVTCYIFLFLFLPAIVLRIMVEEKTLFKIEGYTEFARSRKRIFPAVW